MGRANDQWQGLTPSRVWRPVAGAVAAWFFVALVLGALTSGATAVAAQQANLTPSQDGLQQSDTTTAEVSNAEPFEVLLDRNAALFDVAGLVPGSTATNCLTARVKGPAEGGVVRLFGEVEGSGLADFLDVEVEAGTIPPGGGCEAFRGASIFAGTLAEFGRRFTDAATGAAVPVSGATATIRMRWVLRDDNAAQGLTAAAAFVFEARGTNVVLESPTAATPIPTPSGPAPTSEAGPDAGDADDGGSGLARALTEWLPASVQAVAQQVVEAVVLSSALAARASAFPSTFLVALGVFVVLQHRIDAADPKLARAPTHPEPDLQFLPRRSIGRIA